ncbi:MAG: alpha/beta hydrolase [Parachlamydiaceae bacterium]|nr:alpha/beta hydrolase [Parachlamydiaceae bacterium]
MNYFRYALLHLAIILHFSPIIASNSGNEITPYKFGDNGMPSYEIPASSRFTTKRISESAPDIVYYLSKPQANNYPIVIMCGGSSDQDHIESIIHFHRYFLQELIDLGTAVLTVEQWGIDGKNIQIQEFMEHYTRSQRLEDHQTVIEHLKLHPPDGWNGKLIFLGVSEGGPLVTALTEKYADITIATINWSGAGDWSWKEEVWVYLQRLVVDNTECPHHIHICDCSTCLEAITTKKHYEMQMDATLQNPTPDQYFLNMTYKYHADAILYPKPNYPKIRTPFLVVAGAEDTIIESSDAFVKNAKAAGTDITYLRIANMDHYVRKRPDIIQQSFDWLGEQIINDQIKYFKITPAIKINIDSLFK